MSELDTKRNRASAPASLNMSGVLQRRCAGCGNHTLAGTVEFWAGKKWVSEKATDADNKCKVKDDYSAGVPDPRSP